MIDKSQLRKMLPKNKRPAQLVKQLNTMLPRYSIDTPVRIAAFIAQCAHESNQFNVKEENLNYSKAALKKVFRKYFDNAELSQFARNPEKIANRVYSNRMNNGNEASGDGYRFRGRGYIQLTGRSQYEEFAKEIGKSLDETIEYVETYEGALESACWFWKENNINNYADSLDIKGMTRRINGGYNGLSDRIEYWNKALEIFGVQEKTKSSPVPKNKPNSKTKTKIRRTLSIGDRGKDVKELQERLNLPVTGYFDPRTKRTVKSLQSANGLVVDGIVGKNTISIIFKE